MSIKFFRKRQKLIIIIMVVLMVTFLVSMQGLSSLLQSKAGSEVIGTSDVGKITLGELQNAKVELDIIGRLAQSSAFQKTPEQAYAYYAIKGENHEAQQALAYVLLIKAAEEQGIDVTNGDVDAAITSYKNSNFPFDQFMDQMVVFYNYKRSQVRAIIANWLMVVKAYQASNASYPPSREELQHYYVDINSKMQLKAVTIPASEFVSKIPAPSADKIKAQFQKLKNRPAGDFTGVANFRFGYLIPAKLDVSWMMADYNAFARAEQPTAEQVEKYYNDNKEMFVKDAKSDKKEYKPLAEVKWEIFTQLQMQMAQTSYHEAVTYVGSAVRDKLIGVQMSEDKNVDTKQLMKAAYGELVKPADEMLGRVIPVIYLDKVPLAEAVDQIARLAQPRLKAISFPYGLVSGKIKIDPGVSVSLNAQNITVGQALAKLIKDNKLSFDAGWVRFTSFDNVLFCDALPPVEYGDTGLITLKEFSDDPFFKTCFSREARATLPMMVSQVKELGNEKSGLMVGVLGPMVQSFGPEKAGEVFWTVTKVEPAHAPEELTPDLAKKIADDIRKAEALDLAKKVADEIQTPAQLDEYIKKNKIMPILTQPFSRMTLSNSPYGQRGFASGNVAEMNFCKPEVDKVFIEKAFDTLAPKDISKAYTQASDKLMQLALPCEDYVVVAQRVDYQPALANDFDDQAKEYRKILDGSQMINMLLHWYKLDNIVKRTGFEETTKGSFLQIADQNAQ